MQRHTTTDLLNAYHEIKKKIADTNSKVYLQAKNSKTLANNIAQLSLEDVIIILSAIDNNPDLKKMSLQRSVKNRVLDKLVLMTADGKNPWVLRLHTYPVTNEDDDKIQDDEEHVHYHRWDLTSKFLSGGFINNQYDVAKEKYSDNAIHAFEFAIPATKPGDGQSRETTCLGEKYLYLKKSELYKKGDHVHYPIEIPHSVDSLSAAALTGVTITFAHTGESIQNSSIFFEKTLMNDVPNAHYSEQEHEKAIKLAITRLQLIKLCDELAQKGFARFSHLNSLETELLPTIKMIQLEGDNFKEKNNEYDYHLMKFIINNHVKVMNPTYLEILIINSQKGLMKVGTFVKSIEEIKNNHIFNIFSERKTFKPVDVISTNETDSKPYHLIC